MKKQVQKEQKNAQNSLKEAKQEEEESKVAKKDFKGPVLFLEFEK